MIDICLIQVSYRFILSVASLSNLFRKSFTTFIYLSISRIFNSPFRNKDTVSVLNGSSVASYCQSASSTAAGRKDHRQTRQIKYFALISCSSCAIVLVFLRDTPPQHAVICGAYVHRRGRKGVRRTKTQEHRCTTTAHWEQNYVQ